MDHPTRLELILGRSAIVTCTRCISPGREHRLVGALSHRLRCGSRTKNGKHAAGRGGPAHWPCLPKAPEIAGTCACVLRAIGDTSCRPVRFEIASKRGGFVRLQPAAQEVTKDVVKGAKKSALQARVMRFLSGPEAYHRARLSVLAWRVSHWRCAVAILAQASPLVRSVAILAQGLTAPQPLRDVRPRTWRRASRAVRNWSSWLSEGILIRGTLSPCTRGSARRRATRIAPHRLLPWHEPYRSDLLASSMTSSTTSSSMATSSTTHREEDVDYGDQRDVSQDIPKSKIIPIGPD